MGRKNGCWWEVTYRYNTLCILDYPDEELEASRNPFAGVVQVAKKTLLEGRGLDKELLRQKLAIAASLLENRILWVSLNT